jgi:hypothetical protein
VEVASQSAERVHIRSGKEVVEGFLLYRVYCLGDDLRVILRVENPATVYSHPADPALAFADPAPVAAHPAPDGFVLDFII